MTCIISKQKVLLTPLTVSFLFLLHSCASQNNESKKALPKQNEFDSCSIAKPFENAGITQSMVKPGYTGVLNNYWGTDTTKIDFQHFFANGKLIKSIFYYENGKVKEEYNYTCEALNGLQKYYYDNGKLSKIIPFSYGYRQGTGELFDSNGILRQQVIFFSDSIVGDPKNFDEKGKLIEQEKK